MNTATQTRIGPIRQTLRNKTLTLLPKQCDSFSKEWVMDASDDLQVYKCAFKLAMDSFEASKQFPAEEKYALTDRLRRSSRTVCVLITEAFTKRSFPEAFTESLLQADAENSETQVWLAFSLRCGYLTEEGWKLLNEGSRAVSKMLHNLLDEAGTCWPSR